MSVQHEECGILALQGVQAVNERHVLCDIGKVARVVGMLVVHAGIIPVHPIDRSSNATDNSFAA